MQLSKILKGLEACSASRNLGVCFPRTSSGAVVSLLTALHLRCPYVPLSTGCPGIGSPVQRFVALLRMADIWCVLCASDVVSFVLSAWDTLCGTGDVSKRVIDVEALAGSPAAPGSLAPHAAAALEGKDEADPQDLIHIIFTSGSTGRPKGVCGIHSATLNRLRWQWASFPWKAGEVACARTPLTFIDHVAEVFGAMLAENGPVVLCPRSTSLSSGLLKSIPEFRVTRLVLTPTLLQILLLEAENLEENPWKSLQVLTCSGEALRRSLVAQVRSQIPSNCKLLNIYGSTEVAGDATCADLPQDDSEDQQSLLVPCGRAIDGITVELRTESPRDQFPRHLWEEAASVEAVGEVYVYGRCLAHGYLGGDGDADAFPVLEGRRSFRTQDLAAWHRTRGGERTLAVLGRCGEMVKVRGQRVELASVEATLCSLELDSIRTLQEDNVDWSSFSGPMFSEAICFVHENSQLVAALVLAPALAAHLDAESSTSLMAMVRKHLTHLLPSAAVPSYLTTMPSLPKLSSGKINRRALSSTVCISHDSGAKTSKPSEGQKDDAANQTERLVRQAWRSCLNLPEESSLVQPDSSASFFVVGGDSAGLMKLASRLRQVCGAVLEFDDVIAAASESYAAVVQLCQNPKKRQHVESLEEGHAESRGISRRVRPAGPVNCIGHSRGGVGSVISARLQLDGAQLSMVWRRVAWPILAHWLGSRILWVQGLSCRLQGESAVRFPLCQGQVGAKSRNLRSLRQLLS